MASKHLNHSTTNSQVTDRFAEFNAQNRENSIVPFLQQKQVGVIDLACYGHMHTLEQMRTLPLLLQIPLTFQQYICSIQILIFCWVQNFGYVGSTIQVTTCVGKSKLLHLFTSFSMTQFLAVLLICVMVTCIYNLIHPMEMSRYMYTQTHFLLFKILSLITYLFSPIIQEICILNTCVHTISSKKIDSHMQLSFASLSCHTRFSASFGMMSGFETNFAYWMKIQGFETISPLKL